MEEPEELEPEVLPPPPPGQGSPVSLAALELESPPPKKKRLKLRRVPLKTCMASTCMVAVGVVLLALSLDFYVEHSGHEGALPMLVLSCIALCPGIYSAVNLYGAMRGWPGYHFDALPSMSSLDEAGGRDSSCLDSDMYMFLSECEVVRRGGSLL
eukprot:CAMPEP_0118965204 /NCGR_PEP_ID=MMETSP1173-20130426/2790_1 /TAXON_ID=1034831 /ORGANISM="Rhizochromulina marina cf, Strain CCMP1243" /LENGTH=154 /DNA_ID=CAMNT_0006913785 /DNA_START=18 /DNA_END=483 /DNA_ORIENTATION=-